jgi:hypothetical protein
VTVLVVAVVCILSWIGLMLISFFQNDPTSSGPKVNVASPSASAPPAAPSGVVPPQAPPAAAGQPVTPATVSVYNPGGNGDNPTRARNTIDGKTSTFWRTDQYNQQFPVLKQGVGLVVTFTDAVNLSQVKINGDTKGTKVEIRTADGTSPQLADTKVVGSGDLNDPETTITLPQPQQTKYVIVWITQLGTGNGGKFVTQIDDMSFTAAA